MEQTQTTNTQQTHEAGHETQDPRLETQGARHEGKDPNTIYIGKKGVMGYVLAVVTQFNNNSPEVKIKARGNMISRAVDVAEIVRHRFLTSATVKGIHISTEELLSEDGTKSKVSSIEIVLTK